MDGRELAALISAGMRSPSGPEDTAFYTGKVITWDNLSGVNTVMVNDVVLSNLSAMQMGIGLSYGAGDVVLVMRKQSQYFIVSKIGVPGSTKSTTGSAPLYTAANGGALTGATGGWRDLDSGAINSPVLTARIGGNALVAFGAAYVSTNNSSVEMSVEISGDSTWVAGSFLGQSLHTGNNNGANFGPTVLSAPSKIVGFYRGTRLASGSFDPGTITFAIKYRLGLFNNGTGATVNQPWMCVIPFG